MYENHRKNFPRGDHREFDDDRYGDDRWREARGARERGGAGRFDGDREFGGREFGGRGREIGYGSSFRDDDYGRYGGGYGPEQPGDRWRGQSSHDRGHWAHDAQHGQYGEGAAGRGYSGAGQQQGAPQPRYYTGQQSGWAVRGPAPGAPGGYGEDYLDHGYARHDRHDRGFWDRASDEVASWFGDDDAAQRREADHRGRGPKDYIRSDERIREDANDRLTDDPRIDARDVTLVVQGSEITLDGTVPSRDEKRRAEDVVERISGVKHVQNNLRVQEAGTSGGTPSANWTVNPSPGAEGGTISGTARLAPTGTVARPTAKV